MPRKPNDQLRTLLAVADWTREGLARAVNGIAMESGKDLTYYRTSVSHWLRGSRPRADTPLYIAEALSRRLGRTVTPEEAGFPGPRPESAGSNGNRGSEPFLEVRELARSDLAEIWTGVRQKRLYRQADLDVSSWRASVATRSGARAAAPSPLIAAMDTMISAFATADRSFGGGHARTAVVAYLAGDIVEGARKAPDGAVYRGVCDAAATCCNLAGFMCYDSHLHGFALAYFRIALRLAAEAANPESYAAVLRNISMQAWSLGNTEDAARIAEEAVLAASDGRHDVHLAEVLGHAAVTRAGTNRLTEAWEALASAEESLRRAGSANATVTYQRAIVLEHSGDHAAAQRALTDSLRQRAASERRSRALTHARLAGIRLQTGQVEKAHQAIYKLLEDHAALDSARADAAVGDVARHLGRYRRRPSSNALFQRLETRLAPTSRSRARR